jgi:hypothetical protein
VPLHIETDAAHLSRAIELAQRGEGRVSPNPKVGAVVAVLVAAATYAVLRVTADPRLVHRSEPEFNLVYDDAALREARPRPGELARLQGRHDGLRVAITVLPLTLPAYRGDVARGLLPIVAERHVDALRRRLPGLRVRDEGRGNTNGSPGYQIGYAARSTTWRDTLVVPDEEIDPSPRRGVIVRLEISPPHGRRRAADADVLTLVREAYQSFALGTARAGA